MGIFFVLVIVVFYFLLGSNGFRVIVKVSVLVIYSGRNGYDVFY